MQQQTFLFTIRKAVLCGCVALVFVGLAFGYGYFFGRYEQIQMNRSVLKAIPDVNCSQEVH